MFEFLIIFLILSYKILPWSFTALRLHLFYNGYIVCLFSWRYNPLWLYFHSTVAGFSLLVFEVL